MDQPIYRRNTERSSEVGGTVHAPFTAEQVDALNAYQNAGRMHPFTCPNRGDGLHRVTADLGALVATVDGWVCPDCDYTQGWAHGFMATRTGE